MRCGCVAVVGGGVLHQTIVMPGYGLGAFGM